MKAPRQADDDTFEQTLAILVELPIAALRDRWHERFREAAPHFRSRDLLLRAFVYQLEARRARKRTAPTERRLADLAARFTADRAYKHPSTRRIGSGHRLTGRVRDDRGHPMTSAHANKGAKRHFYYVSTAITTGRRAAAGSLPRVSAPVLERAVTQAIAPVLIASSFDPSCGDAAPLDALVRVMVGADRLRIVLSAESIDPQRLAVVYPEASTHEDGRVEIVTSIVIKPTNATRLIGGDRQPKSARVDRALVRAVACASVWAKRLASGEAASIDDLATREGVSTMYAGKLLPLAFLAPDLVQVILTGRQPAGLTLSTLLATPLPLTWDDQRTRFRAFT